MRMHFLRTLNKPDTHGTVHIMVVNTAEQYSLTASSSGSHWFAVAWLIDREEPE